MSVTWTRDPDVLVTELDRESVLLHPRTRAMFTLNETGQVVWGVIDRGEAAAVDAVLAAFDVERAVADADVRELVQALADAGLITPG